MILRSFCAKFCTYLWVICAFFRVFCTPFLHCGLFCRILRVILHFPKIYEITIFQNQNVPKPIISGSKNKVTLPHPLSNLFWALWYKSKRYILSQVFLEIQRAFVRAAILLIFQKLRALNQKQLSAHRASGSIARHSSGIARLRLPRT